MKPPKIHPNSIIPPHVKATLAKVDAALLDLFSDNLMVSLKSIDSFFKGIGMTESLETEDLIMKTLYDRLKERLDHPFMGVQDRYRHHRCPVPTIDFMINTPVRVYLQFLMFYCDVETYKWDSVRMKNAVDMKYVPEAIGVHVHINFHLNGINPAEKMLRDYAAALSRKYWRHVSIIPEGQDPSFVRLVYGIRSRETVSVEGPAAL